MTAVSDGYNIWTVERKPVSVHLRETVAAQIRAAANAPQEARAGLERGGILWGRVRDTGEDYYLISIEFAEHLACDHTHGEGWVPSEKDRRLLRKRLKSGYGDLQCVGYWRTHQRPGLYLDTRDLDLMATLFSQPWCVALCVRPPSTAGFFLWENGDIHRTSSYREFELPDAEQPAMPPAPALQPTNWRRWAAAAGVAAMLAIAPFLLQSNSTNSPFNMLSMEAETRPGLVRLRWNPESKVLENAPGAVVWIADGMEESKLELTHAQLQAGALDYKPTGTDLNFRMEIGPFTESLRVANAVPGTTGMAEAAAAGMDQVTPQRETARTERGRKMREAESSAPTTFEQAPLAVDEKPQPILESAPPPQIAMAPAKLERPPIQERAPEVPKVVASAEKKGKSPLKKVLGWIPGFRQKDYVPPKVVREVQPRVTAERDTSVIVRVAIDPKGVVTNAALLTKGIDGNLGRSAVEAAKRWRFEPARADDRPVASDMVLRFRFEGTRNN
ncbi:MAG TPA: TonB family protein [Bryobacteraceae bacterium]|nr:TonB family protein [Bryobacteraceae bacterium]